jgi:hypothetical protein
MWYDVYTVISTKNKNDEALRQEEEPAGAQVKDALHSGAHKFVATSIVKYSSLFPITIIRKANAASYPKHPRGTLPLNIPPPSPRRIRTGSRFWPRPELHKAAAPRT